ncbi:2-amino-4-hydroxy-6-hydroxymethyldihydropteridine diphosphokinase [Tropicimonas sp. IMCC34011]|uniref:2-amino-4-hydroxy-6- hydroxymethyldihydropteridine diphosphokinase n=1 Tax=Tropicimonas sp. IMCC34011 TaxID=2248759 RepID=UPI000E287B11|nr:2-amino-4-hydroxy-6-hydroxymethyldihydropteridine diphosphokinase [Tropicimonas sp. IMCC34011]
MVLQVNERHVIDTIGGVALGSNAASRAGSPARTVTAAMRAMERCGFVILRRSRLYRTAAFPAGSGPDFVNAVVTVSTTMGPRDALAALHEIEAAFGRRRHRRWAPRALDLDLLWLGDSVLPGRSEWQRWRKLAPERQRAEAPDELILPHPRIADRPFVLVPLAEAAPDWHHPVTGQTPADMIRSLPAGARGGPRAMSLSLANRPARR